MAFDFPASPAQDQTFTPPGGPNYVYKGVAWKVTSPANNNYVLKSGDTMTGDLRISKSAASLFLDKAASGQYAALGGYTAGKARWTLSLGNIEAESGGNAGSNFNFDRYDDAGNYLGTALFINRANGDMLSQGNLTLDKANPDFTFNRKASGQFARIGSLMNGQNRWWLHFGNPDAEGGVADGSNFSLYAYKNDGSDIGEALRVNRNNMAAIFGGDLTISKVVPNINLNTPASGQNAFAYFQTNGLNRWSIGKEGSAESGANAGSGFVIGRYADNGSLLNTPMVIFRDTSLVQLMGTKFAALSTDPAALDYYGEGAWVPDVQVGGSSAGITYSARNANYIRIGNLVFAQCDIVLANKGAGTGAVDVMGLPFNIVTVVGSATVSSWSAMALPTPVGITATMAGTGFGVNIPTASASGRLLGTHLTNTSQLRISGVYTTS